MNFLFTYGPCANSLSFLTISVSLKFHGRKNFEGPSASISLLIRRMYSFMLGEAVRNFHRFIVASSGRCGNFFTISSRSSSVRYNTAGSHPCTGCLLAPANCTSLSKKQKVCSNKTNSSSPLGCSALTSAGPPACDSILLVLTQQSLCANELSSCVYIIIVAKLSDMSLTRHHSALLAAQADGSSKCSSKDPRGKVKRGQHHYNSPVVVGRSAAQMDHSLYETTPSSASHIIIVGSLFDPRHLPGWKMRQPGNLLSQLSETYLI